MRKVLRFLFVIVLSVWTMDMSAQSQAVQFFAHRASRFEYDENTLPAFKACYEQGIRGFETDIRMSKDGQLVVNHDETFARLTPCTGAVESMTSDEIRKLTTFQGNKILFLDELVGFLSDK